MRLAPSDAVIDEDEVDVVELYFFFAHNVLATVEKPLLLLEKDSTCIIDVPNILNQLRQNLNSRIQQKCYDAEETQKMKLLEADERQAIESELLNVYERMLLYITKRFDFSDENVLSKLKPMTLENIITYDEAVSVAEVLQLDVDQNALFDELVLLQ